MHSDFDMSGRVALVTGASSGLGAHFARVLAGAGAHVVLAARRQDRLEETAEAVRGAGGTADTVALDVTASQSVDDCFHELDRRSLAVDVVINNAGVSREQFLAEMTEATWDAVLDTNLKGVFLVAQAAAQRLIQAGKPGAVVNIASVLGFQVAKTLGAYTAAKAGVVQLTKQMAVEWARYGIRVNAIAPGYFSTEINAEFLESETGQRLTAAIPQRRIGEHGALSGPLLLLASEAGRYMTGSTITVDGGLLLTGLG
ncbi:MAG: SDR family NAD(P)-dependent oxidoreductase [Pseudomonadota bacterium]